MNVKELIQSAPRFELIDDSLALMDIPPERTEAAKERFGEFLDRLDGIEPTSTGYVILGVVYAENGRERLEANLYCDSELPGLAEIKGELAKFDSDSDAERLCNVVSNTKRYAYEYKPWGEILGFRVLRSNARDVGSTKLAAAVLYEMTFFGFNEENVKAEREKLDAAIAEVDLSKEISISAEELFSRFGWRDERTEKEKENERLAAIREQMENLRRSWESLRRYVKRIPLKTLCDVIEISTETTTAYWDRLREKVVYLDSELYTSEQNEVLAEGIESQSERFMRLPEKRNFREYDVMRGFIDSLPDGGVKRDLAGAIHGKGAFRRFKDTLRRHGMERQWYEYRDTAVKDFAASWCDESDVIAGI